jgi:hypothetical protein
MATHQAVPIVTYDHNQHTARCTCADYRTAGRCQHAREAAAQYDQLVQIKVQRFERLVQQLDGHDLSILLWWAQWKYPEHFLDAAPLTDQQRNWAEFWDIQRQREERGQQN